MRRFPPIRPPQRHALAASLCAVTLLFSTSGNARAALTFGFPMNYDTPHVVGTVDGDTVGVPEFVALDLAQALLDMSAGRTDAFTLPIPGTGSAAFELRTTSLEFDGAFEGNTLAQPLRTESFAILEAWKTPSEVNYDSVFLPRGPAYAIAKYDGVNAGFVMFALDPSQDTYLPAFPEEFWTNPTGSPTSLAISNFTVFGASDPCLVPSLSPAIPEPAQLLGVGLLLAAGVLLRRRPRDLA